MDNNSGKNTSKNLSVKQSQCLLAVRQKLLDSAKQSAASCATDALKTASKRAIQKTAAATGNFIGNKKLTKNIQTINFKSLN